MTLNLTECKEEEVVEGKKMNIVCVINTEVYLIMYFSI